MAGDGLRRVVVVGNGMAGSRFVQELLQRDLDRRLSITVIGDEPGGAYNRMQLSNVLAGVTTAESIELASVQWYSDHGVSVRTGSSAIRIDRRNHQLWLNNGEVVAYDSLVLATGSHPVLPPIVGLSNNAGALPAGVVAFRTLADCQRIDQLAASAKTAVVMGGGVLGLEAARALAGRPIMVTLVQRGPRLMERQLDDDAAHVLARTVRALDVRVRVRATVRAVVDDDRVRAVELDTDVAVDTDLLVLCCGVRPRVELARQAGLDVEAGVVVDDQLRSVSDSAVYAIGECAEHRGRTYGLVAPVWEQARVAAHVIAQPERAISYTGSRTVTRLKAAGIELAALGDSTADDGLSDDVLSDGGLFGEVADGGPGDDSTEIVRYLDGARGVYQKLVIRDGRLAGAILLGDTRTVGTLTQLFDRSALLPSDRAGLLIGRRNAATVDVSPTALPGRATVCHCNGVTKSAICDAWQNGARTVTEIAGDTRATTGCGTCRDAVDGLLDWLAAADPDAREPVPDQHVEWPRREATAPRVPV